MANAEPLAWDPDTFPYEQYRDSIRNGDLLAYSSKSTFGRVVRAATHSKYSHVSVLVWLEQRLFAIEVMPPRVALMPLSTLDKLYLFPMGLKDWGDLHSEMILKPIGAKYSYIDAIKGLFKSSAKVDDIHRDSWQCAQYVSYFYQQSGLPFGWQHTPKAVVKKALSLNGGSVVRLA